MFRLIAFIACCFGEPATAGFFLLMHFLFGTDRKPTGCKCP